MSRHTPAEKFVRRSSFLLIALFAVAVLSFKTIHHTAHAQTAGGTRLLRNANGERNANRFRVCAKYLDGPARGRHGAAHYDLPGADFKSAFFS